MRLYLVHCGYYDKSVSEGTYESHTNLFVVAESFEEARIRAKELPEFKRLAMHVDGMQEIQAVQGHPLVIGEADEELRGRTQILLHRKRGHPPKLLEV